jgi:hypothetical protein
MNKKLTRLLFFLAIVLSGKTAYSQNYVSFTYSIDSYCEPSQITFFDLSNIVVSQGPIEYKWYIDTLLVATDQYPLAVPIYK